MRDHANIEHAQTAEYAAVPTAPAIANAIYDACGIRIRDLPMTAEKIKQALQT